jgi:hypothetical protein
MFALWEMEMREHEVPGAVATARVLARDFPENRELGTFLTTYDSTTLVIDPVDGAPESLRSRIKESTRRLPARRVR